MTLAYRISLANDDRHAKGIQQYCEFNGLHVKFKITIEYYV